MDGKENCAASGALRFSASNKGASDVGPLPVCNHPEVRHEALRGLPMGPVQLSRSTLDGWVMRVGELLRPISRAVAQELLAGNYIQADETPVEVQFEKQVRARLSASAGIDGLWKNRCEASD